MTSDDTDDLNVTLPTGKRLKQNTEVAAQSVGSSRSYGNSMVR
jgi:hypothetical protein